MRFIGLFLALLCLSACTVALGPSSPSIVRTPSPQTSSSSNEQPLDTPTQGENEAQTVVSAQGTENNSIFPLPEEGIRRRTIYMVSAGHPNDNDVFLALKSEMTQQDAYFARFNYIDQDIDQIRLGDVANISIDQVIRSSERSEAEFALVFENPFEDGIARVSLSLYCVQSSELIASSNQRRPIYEQAGGVSQALEGATEAAFSELVGTYIRRVEQSGTCPQRDFEER